MHDRRAFLHTVLRGSGVALTLPWLAALAPRGAPEAPRRLLLICLPLGLYRHAFLPTLAPGKPYVPSRYLSIIDELRSDYTVISGLDHPEITV